MHVCVRQQETACVIGSALIRAISRRLLYAKRGATSCHRKKETSGSFVPPFDPVSIAISSNLAKSMCAFILYGYVYTLAPGPEAGKKPSPTSTTTTTIIALGEPQSPHLPPYPTSSCSFVTNCRKKRWNCSSLKIELAGKHSSNALRILDINFQF